VNNFKARLDRFWANKGQYLILMSERAAGCSAREYA